MSLECYIGPEKNILNPEEGHAHRLLVDHPILTNTALYALKHLDHEGHKSKVIDITFNISASSTEDLYLSLCFYGPHDQDASKHIKRYWLELDDQLIIDVRGLPRDLVCFFLGQYNTLETL
jgi:hypothetical protein